MSKFKAAKLMPPTPGVNIEFDNQSYRFILADGTPILNVELIEMNITQDQHQVINVNGTCTNVPGVKEHIAKIRFTDDPVIYPVPPPRLDRNALVQDGIASLVDILKIGK